VIAGLANNWYKDMLVAGTYVTRAYDGAANHAPIGIQVSDVSFTAPSKDAAGVVTASFTLDSGASYLVADHRAGLLLVDESTDEAVYMDYKANLSTASDADGNVQMVTLALPAGMTLPEKIQVFVMLDVFPVHTEEIK
jgi:hypothetical protein